MQTSGGVTPGPFVAVLVNTTTSERRDGLAVQSIQAAA